MTEERHHVVVNESQVPDYLGRGYTRSEITPELAIGPGWTLFSPEERKELAVVEIAGAEHDKLNANPRKERERFAYKDYVFDARIEQVEVLEDGPRQCIVAATATVNPNTQPSGGAEHCETWDLHDTRAEAATAMRPTVRREIERHEEAIGNLRRFLEENPE